MRFHIRSSAPWRLGVALCAAMLAGCAGTAPAPALDYTAFRQANPRSILVLPPVNRSTDANGTSGVWAQTTRPLAESGYYVLPITLVNETFRSNGMHMPEDIQAIAPEKLRQIFGADAALYITVTQYGTRYLLLDSITQVTANARLVSLTTGATLWQGSATASSGEQAAGAQGGLVGLLVNAVVKQIAATVSDRGFAMAGVASGRLLSPRPNGMLHGPYHPQATATSVPAPAPTVR